MILPVLLLICVPAYEVFIKGDTQEVATGGLEEGLASGDGLASLSDKVDLNEPTAPPPVLVDGGEPGGPPPTAPSDGPITML